MAIDYYSAILGSIGAIAGAFGAAAAAKRRRKELGQLAETPGVDVGDVTSQNLFDIQANTPGAIAASRGLTLGDQATLNELLEGSMPGYQARQAKQSQIIDSMLAGEVPEDVSRQLARRTAARSTEGGYARSPFSRNLEARDFAQTSRDYQMAGLQAAGNFAQTTRQVGTAPLLSAAQFAGITPSQAVDLRSKERTQMLQILLEKVMAVSPSEIWSKTASNLGESFMGMSGSGGKTV